MSKFKVTKLVAAVIGFTMVLGVAFTGTTVKAQTAAELQAQIAGLLATIQALQAQLAGMGGTPTTGGSCAFTFTQNLTVGSTGTEVKNLQVFLNLSADTQVAAAGVGSKGFETSTFGPATKAAVMKFQAKYAAEVLTPAGLTAPTGYWGALTRAKANALCAGQVPPVVVPGPGTTPSPVLKGTDGSIANVTEITSYNNEEVSEGQDNVKVLGMEVEATNDGDIALKSMKVSFTFGSADASDNLDDYIEKVSIYQGSTKVGSADVSDFSESTGNVFSKTITLSNAIVRADQTEKFYVAVDSVSNMDSADFDADWTVDVENIRFEDGSGVVTTETDFELDGMNVPIDFVDFATAADTDLHISLDSTSPDAGIVMVDDTSNTDDVVLLKGKIKANGDSDVTIDELPITFTLASGTQAISDVASSFTLKLGSEEFTENAPSTVSAATVTFDNLDFKIDAGQTVSFTVLANINAIDDVDFDEGDKLTASLTSTNRNYIDAENEEGDQLSDSTEKTGTATGAAQEFRTSGISASLVSATADENTNDGSDNDSVTYNIKFKVTATGDDVYVSSLVANAVTYAIDRSGTATTDADINAVLVNNTDDTKTSVGNYLIEDGETNTFTLTIAWTPNQDGLYRAALTGIKWDTSDDTSPANTYTSNLDSFKTEYANLD